MLVTTYNHHVRLLSPEPFGWVRTTKAYSGLGADIVMESITLIDRGECPQHGSGPETGLGEIDGDVLEADLQPRVVADNSFFSEWHVYRPLGDQVAALLLLASPQCKQTGHSLSVARSIVAYGLQPSGSFPSPNRTRTDRR
jgi:hypothetical protein